MELETRPSLFPRLRDGGSHDQDAWREFHARYRAPIVGYCRARGLQESDADDVCQLVMIGLTRSLTGFEYDRARGRFRDYLATVVRHAVHRFHQGRRSLAESDGSTGELEDLRKERDEEWERQWMLHHFRTALGTLGRALDPRSIAIFERLADGSEPENVAAEFGATRAAVQKVRQRVRAHLQERISAQLAEERSA